MERFPGQRHTCPNTSGWMLRIVVIVSSFGALLYCMRDTIAVHLPDPEDAGSDYKKKDL